MACCGDLGYPIVHQPAELKAAFAAAGKKGAIHVCYQPLSGDIVEHWEHVGWLCIYAQNLILVCDEVDRICSANAPKDARSPYWKRTSRTAALEHIVQYGRHARIAFVGIARAPQDVWRRLTGQCGRMIVFRMVEPLELDAVRGRLGSAATDELPHLGKYEYLDWTEDGNVYLGGGETDA
jgi:hypothetical protein